MIHMPVQKQNMTFVNITDIPVYLANTFYVVITKLIKSNVEEIELVLKSLSIDGFTMSMIKCEKLIFKTFF